MTRIPIHRQILATLCFVAALPAGFALFAALRINGWRVLFSLLTLMFVCFVVSGVLLIWPWSRDRFG
jgi:hypothetical protein